MLQRCQDLLNLSQNKSVFAYASKNSLRIKLDIKQYCAVIGKKSTKNVFYTKQLFRIQFLHAGSCLINMAIFHISIKKGILKSIYFTDLSWKPFQAYEGFLY